MRTRASAPRANTSRVEGVLRRRPLSGRLVTALPLVAALLAAFAGTALAEPTDVEQARTAFERGVALHKAGEHEAALPHLERAYALSGRRPSTIFALAQCERALGHHEDALTHLREYLATGLDAEETARIERTIREVEAQAAASPPPALPPPRVAPPPPPLTPTETETEVEPSEGVLSSPVFWIVAGAVVVGAVIGGVAIATSGDDYGGSSDVVARFLETSR